jgi:hypothetical protein
MGRWEKNPAGKIKFEPLESPFANPGCYLSSLENCTSKMTKEHFVSRNILERIATNNTLDFQGAGHFFGGKENARIGIDGFSAR